MQQLMGSLNNICLMCPFLNAFKKPLNGALGFLQRNPGKETNLPIQAKKDLKVFYNFLSEQDNWLPIPVRPYNPPLAKITFTSDAAGWNEKTPLTEKVVCASIGVGYSGELCFAAQLLWSDGISRDCKDKRGRPIGSKTTTLEFLGLLLPFLATPKKLENQHIILEVDNISCIYAWENKYAKEDEMASILVKSLVIISSYLGSKIYVKHLPRMSTWQASLVDRMSRESTTTKKDKEILMSFPKPIWPQCLTKWLQHPIEDDSLAFDLLRHVEDN